MATDIAPTGSLSRNFDTETVDKALWVLALHAGSPKQASNALAAQGIRIPRQTLHRWKTEQHAERYARICTDASREIADKVAADAERFMLQAARVERKALKRLAEQLDADEIKDVSSALRNITTSKALNNDKIASPLRGRPTHVVEHKTAEEALKSLERLGMFTRTEEIQDAQVVETASEKTVQLPASS